MERIETTKNFGELQGTWTVEEYRNYKKMRKKMRKDMRKDMRKMKVKIILYGQIKTITADRETLDYFASAIIRRQEYSFTSDEERNVALQIDAMLKPKTSCKEKMRKVKITLRGKTRKITADRETLIFFAAALFDSSRHLMQRGFFDDSDALSDIAHQINVSLGVSSDVA